MRSASVFLPARERYKTNCIKVIGEIRACILELGRRMVDRGALDRAEQVYFLRRWRARPLPARAGELHRDACASGRPTSAALSELEPPFMVIDAAEAA